MLTHEDNETLVRVSKGTPMGDMLRRYWHPVCRSEYLERDGAPRRVRAFGENFVAFRSTDGRVGVFDEACPHRCASLALARNEDNGLRCIFHGWKFDVCGTLVEVPTEPEERRVAFAKRVPAIHYPVREAGGIVWAYLSRTEAPPRFPDLEFTRLPADQVDVRRAVIHVSWLQAMEAVLDSAHLGFLHRGQLQRDFSDARMASGMQTNFALASKVTAPKFEILRTPYGFREGALRQLPDGSVFAKIREFVAPYYSFLPGFPENPTRRMLIASVPIDDEHCAQWCIFYSVDGPLVPSEVEDRWKYALADKNNFYESPGTPENSWGQDRVAMRNGHFSGFPNRHIYVEDFVVQESMGPIVDRTREHLSQSDAVIAHVRRRLIDTARACASGGAPWGMEAPHDYDYGRIRSCAVVLPPGRDWREVDAFSIRPPGEPAGRAA